MKYFKVVLTGGPRGGKSTIQKELVKELSKDYRLYNVPETATEISSNLVKPTCCDEKYFQKKVFDRQLFKENEALDVCNFENKNSSIILCDRGLFDNLVYLTDKSNFDCFVSDSNSNYLDLLDSYNLVIHLESSTLNDDLEYENDTNLERYESRDIARGLDYKTKKAYLGHRNVKVIKPYTDFSLKKKEVIDTINDQIKNGIPYVNNEFDATNYYLNIPNDHVCIDNKVYDHINLYDDIISRIIIRNYKGYSNYLYQTIDDKNKRILSESKISDLSNYSSFINNSIKKEFKEMCFYLDNDLYKVRLYKDGTKTINVNDKKYVDDEKQISKVCVKK